MKRRIRAAIHVAFWTGLSGTALAHHGPADDLGGQLVHATFDPAHLVVTILVAGAIFAGYRLIRVSRRGPTGSGPMGSGQ